MLAVECCMRFYAQKLGEDVETWGRAGLLHDFDYELHPDEHPLWGIDYLRQMGESEEVIGAIASHYEEKTGVAPDSPIQRNLYACDEITGFITACCYVRPSRSVLDLEPSSVRKKMKSLNFAAAVSREDLLRGADLIGISFDDHLGNIIQAMRLSAEELGLKGDL